MFYSVSQTVYSRTFCNNFLHILCAIGYTYSCCNQRWKNQNVEKWLANGPAIQQTKQPTISHREPEQLIMILSTVHLCMLFLDLTLVGLDPYVIYFKIYTNILEYIHMFEYVLHIDYTRTFCNYFIHISCAIAMCPAVTSVGRTRMLRNGRLMIQPQLGIVNLKSNFR